MTTCFTRTFCLLKWEERADQPPELLAWSTLRDAMPVSPTSLLLKIFISIFETYLWLYISRKHCSSHDPCNADRLKTVTLNLCTYPHNVLSVSLSSFASWMNQLNPLNFLILNLFEIQLILCSYVHLSWSLLGAFATLRKETISFFMSVCPSAAWNNSAPTGRIFTRFDIWVFSKKLKFRWNLTRVTGTLHEELRKCLISGWIRLTTRKASDKSCRQNQTHIFCSITFIRKSCRLWDNVEKYGTAGQAADENITRHMRFACWINKARNTHSECVIVIAFPQ
jgi:hypothetical protein